MNARRLFNGFLPMLAFTAVAAGNADANTEASVWPVTQGQVVTGFGKHRGVDIAAAEGTPVQAFRAGVVVTVDTKKGCGRRVIVQHPDLQSTYCNLREVTVTVGEQVAAGGHLARIDAATTGTRAHLHFELQSAGTYVDPLSQLPKSGPAR